MLIILSLVCLMADMQTNTSCNHNYTYYWNNPHVGFLDNLFIIIFCFLSPIKVWYPGIDDDDLLMYLRASRLAATLTVHVVWREHCVICECYSQTCLIPDTLGPS